GEEERLSVLHLLMMLMIPFHITNGVDTDKPSDKRNDDAHQDREPVHHHMWSLRHFSGKFHIKHQCCLQHRQNSGHDPSVPNTHPDDQTHEKNIPHCHEVIDDLCPWIKCPGLRPAANPV